MLTQVELKQKTQKAGSLVARIDAERQKQEELLGEARIIENGISRLEMELDDVQNAIQQDAEERYQSN